MLKGTEQKGGGHRQSRQGQREVSSSHPPPCHFAVRSVFAYLHAFIHPASCSCDSLLSPPSSTLLLALLLAYHSRLVITLQAS